MKMNEAKIKAVLALPGAKRYSHFIKVAADQRKTWGLFSDGWALAETSDGKPAFPLWPAQEYADLCAGGSWSGYKSREIDLNTLLEVLIPKLKESGTLLGIFPTPSEKGITPDFNQFEADLRNELARIE
ncbi:MAG: DUF2750 domain-containing protein [Verrucomicrobiae bacterium]|nr:DUF2750 domain-containing protein [Verrucomicrobiae bacterium]